MAYNTTRDGSSAEYEHLRARDQWNPEQHRYERVGLPRNWSGGVTRISRLYTAKYNTEEVMICMEASGSRKGYLIESTTALLKNAELEFEAPEPSNSSRFSFIVNHADDTTLFRVLRALLTKAEAKDFIAYPVIDSDIARDIVDQEISRLLEAGKTLSDIGLSDVETDVLDEKRTVLYGFNVSPGDVSVDFSGTVLQGVFPVSTVLEDFYPAVDDNGHPYPSYITYIHLEEDHSADLKVAFDKAGMTYEDHSNTRFEVAAAADVVVPVLAAAGMIPKVVVEKVQDAVVALGEAHKSRPAVVSAPAPV